MLVGTHTRGTAGRPCTRAEAARAALGEVRVVAISAPQMGPAGGGGGVGAAGGGELAGFARPQTAHGRHRRAARSQHVPYGLVPGRRHLSHRRDHRCANASIACGARGQDGEGVSGGSMSRQFPASHYPPRGPAAPSTYRVRLRRLGTSVGPRVRPRYRRQLRPRTAADRPTVMAGGIDVVWMCRAFWKVVSGADRSYGGLRQQRPPAGPSSPTVCARGGRGARCRRSGRTRLR